MDMHANYTNTTVNLTGKKFVIRDFEGKRQFLDELQNILQLGGFEGEISAFAEQRIKGAGNFRGLTIGLPNETRRQVEVRWQGGGNESRISVQLSVPGQLSVDEFYQRLKSAFALSGATSKENEMLESTPAKDNRVTTVSATTVVLSDTEIDLFMHEVVQNATASGAVTRDDCSAVLNTLDRTDPESDIAQLIVAGVLNKGKIKSLLFISTEWLSKLRAGAPKHEDVAMQLPPETPPASSSDVVASVSSMTKLVAKANEHRELIGEHEREVRELEALIIESRDRLEVLRMKIREGKKMLESPELKRAEETLLSLKQLLVP